MSPDANTFKEAMRRFPSGVTVVTTLGDAGRHGLTVSAFSSVSAEPPLILVCLGNDTDSKPILEKAGIFAVNLLGLDGAGLGSRFAGMVPELDDPFEGLMCTTASTGSPILPNCPVYLDCRVEAMHPCGDHVIVVGAVEAVGLGPQVEPILYYDRAWRALDPELVKP